jgi:hypothetical protein
MLLVSRIQSQRPIQTLAFPPVEKEGGEETMRALLINGKMLHDTKNLMAALLLSVNIPLTVSSNPAPNSHRDPVGAKDL